MNEIYLGVGGQSIGPLSIEDIQRKLQAGEISGKTAAIIKGTATWTTVRALPGIDPLLLPPEDNPMGGVGEAFNTALSQYGKTDPKTRTAVTGFLIWIGALLIGTIIGWVLQHSVYYGSSENLLVVSVLWLFPLIAALLRGDAWASKAATITASAALIALALRPDLIAGLGAPKPGLAIVYAVGEAGLVVSLLALLKSRTA